MKIGDLLTPALLVERSVLEDNLKSMQERCNALNVALRPHIKTHKCIEIARRQAALGARGLTVSTFYEAEQFAAAGFEDITWAFPIPPVYIPRVLELCERATIRVTVDGTEACEYLEQHCARAGKKLHVWLKVEVGYHRAGVHPGTEYAERTLRALNDSKVLVFDGILSHGGMAYEARSRDRIRPYIDQERTVMAAFAEEMRAAGYRVPAVSIGSTPGMSVVENLDGVTEVRPGNYIFYDYTQAAIGSVRPHSCALSVLSSIISRQPGATHFLIDAGALALSKDLGPTHTGGDPGMGMLYEDYGARQFHTDIRLQSVSQEIGKVAALKDGTLGNRCKVGERIRILPHHACLTTPNFDRYHVVQGDEVIAEWKILRGRS